MKEGSTQPESTREKTPDPQLPRHTESSKQSPYEIVRNGRLTADFGKVISIDALITTGKLNTRQRARDIIHAQASADPVNSASRPRRFAHLQYEVPDTIVERASV